MGSLATHFSAFLFLFPIGIRRLLCCFSLYLKNPSVYRSKTWYLSEPRWKTIDLYILVIALPVASFSEFFLFLTFSGHPTYRFAFFQKSLLVSMFWLLVIFIVARESFDPFVIDENLLFLFAAVAFLIEYSMTQAEISISTTPPLALPAARVYHYLAALTLVSFSSCLFISFKPTAFFAEVALSSSLIFKATWVLQAGLSLYSDAFSLKGCQMIHDKASVQCDLEEDALRGVAIINLLFVGHAIALFILSSILFGALACNKNWRCGEGTCPSLSDIDSQSLLMRPLPEALDMD